MAQGTINNFLNEFASPVPQEFDPGEPMAPVGEIISPEASALRSQQQPGDAPEEKVSLLEGRNQAMEFLTILDPQMAQNVQGLLDRRNRGELAEANRIVEFGAKSAVFIDRIDDPLIQKAEIRKIIQKIRVENSDEATKTERIRKWTDISNMKPLERGLALQKMEVMGTSLKTLLAGADKERLGEEDQIKRGTVTLFQDLLSSNDPIETQKALLGRAAQTLAQSGKEVPAAAQAALNAPDQQSMDRIMKSHVLASRTKEQKAALALGERGRAQARLTAELTPRTASQIKVDNDEAANILAGLKTIPELERAANAARPEVAEILNRIITDKKQPGAVDEKAADIFKADIKALRGKPKAEAKPNIVKIAESLGLVQGTPEFNKFIEERSKKTGLVEVKTFEKESEKLAAKSDAAVRDEIRENARTASRQLGRVRSLSNLLDKAETGALKQFISGIGRFVPGFRTLFPNLPEAQAASAAINAFVLDRMQAFKGTTSDRELEFARQTVAQLGNTPEANKIILRTFENVIFLAQQENKQFDKFVEKGGKPRDFIFDFEKPLFPNDPKLAKLTLDNLQATAFRNGITIQDAMKESLNPGSLKRKRTN